MSSHADVSAVSKNSVDFSSQENGAIIRFAPDMTRDQVELQSVMLINQDPPDHTKIRSIISRGFTPRSINGQHDMLVERANNIIDEAIAKGSGNFVDEVASELPLQAIADLMGVPQEDRGKLFDWSNTMMSYDDPDFEGNPDEAAAEILMYAMGLAAQRAEDPQDDIITKLITADVDGHGKLSDDEFGYFVIMLAVAGNETTRNAITHGMNAFFDNPDQWELWKKERPSTMVDEVIRWATPVTVFQRTAINDVMVGDVAGQGGRARGHLLRQRQPRRGRVHEPGEVRHHSRPEPAPVVRWPRCALLHRRQPGSPRGRDHVQRARRPPARHHPDGRGQAAAPRLDQRHQGAPGQVRLSLAPPETAGHLSGWPAVCVWAVHLVG